MLKHIHNLYPLTSSQNDVWLCCALSLEAKRAFNESLVISLSGQIDEVRMKYALTTLFKRHYSWRVNFLDHNYQPFQYLRASDELIINEKQFNLEQENIESVGLTIARQIENQVNTLFNFSEDQLLCCTIYNLQPSMYIINLLMPHLVIDGYSNNIFVKELFELYNQVELSKPTQYFDYLILDKERIEGNLSHHQFWKETLSKDHPKPFATTKAPSFIGSHYQFQISIETSEQVIHFCKSQRVTQFCVLMYAFAKTISQLSHLQTFYIGIPLSKRVTPEDYTCLGLASAVYPVLIDFSNNLDTTHYIKQLQRQIFMTLDNRFVNFSHIYKETPYNILFNFDEAFDLATIQHVTTQVIGLSAPYERLNFNAIGLTSERLSSGHAQFDLTLNISYQNKQYYAVMEYDTSLFEAEFINQLISFYNALIKDVLCNNTIEIGM